MHESRVPFRRSPITLWLMAGFVLLLIASSGCGPKTAVVVTEPGSDAEGDAYVNNAEKMAEYGQYKTSNYFLKKAIERYENSGIWEKAIQCYIKIGANYQKLDESSIALGSLNQALTLSKKHLGYPNLELATNFKRIGYQYLRKGDPKKALESYHKALSIQLDILGENHPEVAKTYNSIALVQWNNKESVDANQSYIRSYSIKLRQYQGVPKNMETKYQGLDEAEFKKGEFKKAREHFSRSLDEYTKKYGPNKPLFARLYEQIGILYAFEGDYDNALDFIRKGFNIRLEIYGDFTPETAIGYLNMGICLRLKGEYEDARNALETALKIKTERHEEFHPDTADIYYQLGLVEFHQDQLPAALAYYQKALIALVPDFEDNRVSANPSLQTLYPKEKLLDILIAKADAQKMSYMQDPGNTDTLFASFDTYRTLCDLVERMRHSYKSESYKLYFGEKTYKVFKESIQAALLLYEETGDEKYKQQAFILSERSKAGVLAEALSESRARQFADIPKELLEKERTLKTELTYCDTYLQKEYYKLQDFDPQTSKSIESRYYNLMVEYRELIEQFERNYPRYYALKYETNNVDIDKLQAALSADTAMVEYFIGDYALYIFVLTQSELNVVQIPLDEDLEKQVNTYYDAIKKIEERPYLELSWKLYGWLMEPVMKMIAGKQKIIIIPDGPLYYVPFETLNTGRGSGSSDLSRLDYLIKHFAFSYHYSANLWLYGMRRSEPGLAQEKTFIGFAPVFGSDNREGYILVNDPSTPSHDNLLTMREAERGPGAISRLPATEEEVRSIIQLFKQERKKATGYFHKQATEYNFKTAGLQGYNLIHVATHSLKDEGQSQLSGLMFSMPEQKSGNAPSPGQSAPVYESEDGVLYSGEIYNMDLDANLVVLSSCESGVGKLIKGEGMMALNRGFFYSGIRNIIFSLWKVEDRSTSKLMIAFYRNVLKGQSYSIALRNAKLEMINDRFTAFPKYWSGFVLVGI